MGSQVISLSLSLTYFSYFLRLTTFKSVQASGSPFQVLSDLSRGEKEREAGNESGL